MIVRWIEGTASHLQVTDMQHGRIHKQEILTFQPKDELKLFLFPLGDNHIKLRGYIPRIKL